MSFDSYMRSKLLNAFTSSLSRAQFELIEPLLPKAKPDGRPRKVDLFIVLNAIL